jgi:hypothetical protein
LFLQGQDLFHLFLIGDFYSVKRKRYNSNEWESISNLESDPPVEDSGVTEKQPEKQPEEGGSQQPEGLVVPALDLESDPPVEDAGVTEKQPEEGGSQDPALDLESDQPVEDAGVTKRQPEEGGWQQPEDRVDPALGWSWGEDGTPTWRSSQGRDGQGTRNLDPEPEEAAAMEDKEEVVAETAQAKSPAEIKAEKKKAKAKSTSEMKAKKKKAAQAELIAQMEAKKNKAAQAESNVEMEDKEHAAAETTVLRDEAAAEPAKDAEATAKSTAEIKSRKE